VTKEEALELHLTGGEFELCPRCDGSGQELDIAPTNDTGRWIPCTCDKGCVPTEKYHRALEILEAEAVSPGSSASSELLCERHYEDHYSR
jgi:hypothetical protein